MRTWLPVLALAVPACTTELATSSADQAATYYRTEQRRCDVDFCFLHVEQDSDGDGIPDADELAAGTNPKDPLSFPSLIDLARLAGVQALPSFETGNSMFISLPTTRPDGTTLFAGSVDGRRSALDAAGIKIPEGMDLASGFAMARTVKDHEISFTALYTALAPASGPVPVRLLANAVAWSASGSTIPTTGGWDLEDVIVTPTSDTGTTQTGTIEITASAWTQLSGTYVHTFGGLTTQLTNYDGSFLQFTSETTGTNGDTITDVTRVVTTTSLGEKVTTTTDVHTVTTKHGVSTKTTTKTVTVTDRAGNQTTTRGKDDVQTTDPTTHSHEPDEPAEEEGDEKSHDNDTGATGHDPGAGGSHGYWDPETATEYSGAAFLTPASIEAALVKLGSNITVVHMDNTPLNSVTISPLGLGNKYGPIALYAEGDQKANTFGGTPAFVHIPVDADPRLLDKQFTPPDAPPDDTCVYCFQAIRR